MNQDPLLYIKEYEIRGGEIGLDKKIMVPAFVQLLQEASLQHAIALKASIWDLGNISWVLLSKEINFYQYPGLGEKITIETFPSGVDKIFAYRDYYVYNEKRELIATAPSTWTLMDMDSRSIVKIPESLLEIGYPKGKEFLERCKRKIRIPESLTQPTQHKVNIFHMDWNGHVNNVHYLRFIMESNAHHLDAYTPKKICIQYKQESLLHDELIVLNNYESKESTFHKIIRKGSDKSLINCHISWEKKG